METKLIAIDAGAHRAHVIAQRDALIALTMQPGRLSLVERIARQLVRGLRRGFDVDELVGVGQIALLSAALRYHPARGTWLSWARLKVTGAMLDSMRGKGYREQTRPGLQVIRIDEEKAMTVDIAALDRAATLPTAAEAIDRRRAADRVRDAMSWLPGPQRSVLEEFYSAWEPTLAQVAERLGCSPATVHARRKKALAALRERLKTAA